MAKKSYNVFSLIIIGALISLAAVALTAEAGEQRDFHGQFAAAYRSQQFNQMIYLVKTNKDAITVEVRSLIKDALAEGRPFAETMELLDMANAVATMSVHWNNGSEGLLAEVEAAQRDEAGKDEARRAEAERWVSYEKFPGNFVMASYEAGLKAAGLAPVIFPHWRHNFYYECKACHDGIFKIQRGAAPFSQKEIAEGAFCGRCHNGKTSFAADRDCERCHLAGTPGEGRVVDLSTIDLAEVAKTAARLGSGWDAPKLAGRGLPLDRFGFIDWEALRKKGVYSPIKTIEDGAKVQTRQNAILFKAQVQGVKDVLFDHAAHTEQIGCSTCHQEIFKDIAGGNAVAMSAIASGKFCGVCHGKASFKLADCARCHAHDGTEPPVGAVSRGRGAVQ